MPETVDDLTTRQAEPLPPEPSGDDGAAAGPWTRNLTSFQRILLNMGLITAGSIIYIIGLNSILVPQKFLNGGTMGICLIIHYLFPVWSLGLLYALVNIPLFLLGWFSVSRSFIWYTAFGIVIFSVLTDLIQVPALPIKDTMLSAILAGTICGIGCGVILRSSGSAGGLDIVSIYLYKKFELRLGWTSFFFNAVILVLAAFIFSLEMALYTLVFVFTQSKLIDAVVTGFNQRKMIIIVSDKSESIAARILEALNRGVTYLDGQGAYTGKKTKVLLSVTSMSELARMKDLVFGVDPHAFVVINDTMEVLGLRHGQRKVY